MVERENTIPLVVKHAQVIEGVCWTSKKTAEKTLEQGILWIIHPVTRKEIVYSPEISIAKVHIYDYFCVAEVDEQTHYGKNTWKQLTMLSLSDLEISNNNSTKTAEISSAHYTDLAVLEEVIKDRKTKLPEGSYTTHLFQKGKNKIRKKVGEEAIEVLLAKNSEEVISESADLLYHLFVMLINEGLSPKKVVQELLSRHGN